MTNNVVSVGIEVGSSVKLFKLNKEKPLVDTIKQLVSESDNISYADDKFALQYIRNHTDNKLKGKYVTEENKQNIVNGTELKLVFSPRELAMMICDNLRPKHDICWGLEKLASHVDDRVFVSEIFPLCYPFIIVFVNDEKLPSKLYNYCLKTILGFLQFDFIDDLNLDLIKRLIKNIDSDTYIEPSIMENSLRLLELSASKNQYSFIVNTINMEDLIPHIWDRDSPVIQECALALINTIAYCCPNEDAKLQFLKTMNSSKFRSTISSNILYPDSEPSNDLAQQLYIYQTLIFNLLLEFYDPVIFDFNTLPDVNVLSANKRYSNLESSASDSLSEYHTDSADSSRNSRNLSQNNDRISYSWKSDNFHSKRDTLVLSFLNLEIAELNKEIKSLEEIPSIKTINQLTHNCIMYFSKRYQKNYQCCLSLEGSNNFVTISYDVLNLIVNDVLCVGEPPVPGSTVYYPLVFSATNEQPFLEELFSVAMWLFLRTKREMRAATYEDYKKVLKVMKRQLSDGLAAQPKTFHELELKLRGFSYATVNEQWYLEMKLKQQQFLGKSTAVKELKALVKNEMIELIKNQRISYITKGSLFPVWNSQQSQKEKNTFWFARLYNKKFIQFSTNVSRNIDEINNMKTVSLRDVEELVTGKKCLHLKGVKWEKEKESPMGFSLVTDANENKSLDFVAGSREIYDNWVDALNILLGNKMKSRSFHMELSTLIDVEIQIRLLDLEGIECTVYDPPPIPPLPDNYDFNF